MTPGDALAEDLPLRALSRPLEALATARSLLASEPTDYQAALAHQAAGIVLRDQGDLPAALLELRAALTLAKRSGRIHVTLDVRGTLGTALVWSGRTREGLSHLDAAVAQSSGVPAARNHMRRAAVLLTLGRYHAALADLNTALPLFRQVGDLPWQGRVLTRRADVNLMLGHTALAQADFDLAEDLFRRSGQHFEFALARHNQGAMSHYLGDLPKALGCLDEAAGLYRELGTSNPDLVTDRCAVLLAAGLAGQALRELDEAISEIGESGGSAFKAAEFLYLAAVAAVGVPSLDIAIARAESARRSFRVQGRELWTARASLVLTQARFASGGASSRLLHQAESLAETLSRLDPVQAGGAQLLAARLSLALGRVDEASPRLEVLARARRRGAPLARSQGWLALALLNEAQDRPRAAGRAARAGLSALNGHLSTLGSSELKAHATTHGAELAAIGQRLAVSHGTPRSLLVASERWRATSLTTTTKNGPVDPELAALLTALRAVTRRLGESRNDGVATGSHQREIRRLERAIRERAMQTSGRGEKADRLDVRQLTDTPENTCIVTLVDVDGTLNAVTISSGRVRRHTLGALPTRALEHSRFLLRRLAGGALRWSAHELLDPLGVQLERDLLGDAVDDLAGDGPLVIVPPGTLHSVPWSLLPSLRHREIAVAPSVASWHQTRARARERSQPGRVTFVVGPGLGSGAGEVGPLAASYPEASVIGGVAGPATAPRVLAALDGVWLGHIAAHGNFRSDNPLFSALVLDDGPLTVHDFEQLDTPPHRLVLACCDSGLGLPAGADELLGLVSSLLQLGSAGVLAAIVPINDPATVPLMTALHAELAQGADLPRALLRARMNAEDDPVSLATGYSFIAFGT